MVTITLDDRDEAVLERLRRDDTDVESLAESVGVDAEYLRDRLPELADNGLVERVDGEEYALTDHGTRAVAEPIELAAERMETPPDVDEHVRSLELRPDREAALRDAFSFLRYWGQAYGSEIVDAVYDETPAGYDSGRAWWDDCVRERLAALPSVEPPASDDEPWRYDGPSVVEERSDG